MTDTNSLDYRLTKMIDNFNDNHTKNTVGLKLS